MRITNIIAIAFMAISLAAFCCFLFYPYSELGSMQAKRDVALSCLYIISGSVIGLAVTTCIAAKR